jgi:hypothetical protein
MNQLTNYKHKIDFLISNDASLLQPTQTIVKSKKCNECKKREPLHENLQICYICYRMKTLFKPSGNKIIDDFIRHTQINLDTNEGRMEFVPFDQFINIKFIAEGGFSKIYKATWIDGPIYWGFSYYTIKLRQTIVLKKLNNSKNITSKELNEVTCYYSLIVIINLNKSSIN